jgi:hypothetical protein
VVVPKAAKTMAGLAVEAACSAPGALIAAMSSSTNNHLNLRAFTMTSSCMRLIAKKKSLSHGDLRIAPSFLILILAYRPLGLVGA